MEAIVALVFIATVLFVLERFMNKNPHPNDLGLMLSFGPGFTAQQILVRW
jgi:predicted naringenin-chalcone synthase